MNLEDLKQIPSSKEDETIYSGYFVGKTRDELQNWLGKEFSKSSDIRSLKTKRSVQAILEKYKDYFEKLEDEKKYSFQFFCGSDFSFFFDLDKNHLSIISRYHKKDFWLFEESSIEYWMDFYFNDKFISIYEVTKNEAFQHYYFTKTKFEERDRLKPDFIRDYLVKFPALLFLQNKSKMLEKYGPQMEEQPGRNKHEQLINTVSEYELQKNIQKLEKQMEEMEKCSDKFLFGNEVIKGIQNYEVKEIYCFQDFRSKLESKLPKDLFNFTWIIVPRKLENPVISKLESYRGIFAVKYF